MKIGVHFSRLSPFWFGMAVHLWQTALFVAALWLVACALRRTSARIQSGLYWVGVLKLLLPLPLLGPLANRLLESIDVDPQRLRRLLAEAKAVGIDLDEELLAYSAREALEQRLLAMQGTPLNRGALEQMKAAVDQALLLPFAVDMGKLEIALFRMLRENDDDSLADLLSDIGRTLRLAFD